MLLRLTLILDVDPRTHFMVFYPYGCYTSPPDWDRFVPIEKTLYLLWRSDLVDISGSERVLT